MADAMGERQVVLPMLPAGPGTRRLALIAVAVSLATFLVIAPFAQVKLPQVPAFLACYELAVVINNLITAVLIVSQFTIARSRALLVLACGYFFTALMAAIHALTFPGLFSEPGLLGALRESTIWLYVFWHVGFPLAVIAYVVLEGTQAERVRLSAWRAVLVAAAVTAGTVLALAAIAFTSEGFLPPLVRDHGLTLTRVVVIATIVVVVLVALVLLWRRPTRSVLDLWLLVALVAWLADIGLSLILNAGRFDLGFYAGRLFGLAQASFVLLMLLLETGALYQRLARSLEAERVERERRLNELQSELIHVSRLSELGHMVLALAHEVNQPLNAITNYIRAGQRMIETGGAIKARPVLDKAANQALRAGQIIDRLRSFVKNGEAVRHVEHLENVIQETVELALVGSTRKTVKPELRLHPDATIAVIDRIQIQQVLLNLIRNAIDAMANSIDRELIIATAPFGDDMIEISVADRGPGLAAEVRDRLFQPFVTTKMSGMGVGLSISRSIVEAHGGHIAARDNPGGGAVFWFCVPRAREGVGHIAA